MGNSGGVALVTGANRGIRREVARHLAERGYRVLLSARDGAQAMAAAAEVVWLATLPDDGPTGGFFRDGAPAVF
jgi:NAD(P)-dependent dehydrogenase (short-subunit alcohol dehydrogenase family)